jgi:small subunit ribosomal protein S6e
MAEIKLSIGQKDGKTVQIVVTDNNAKSLMGKKIGEKIKGESFDMPGYEFEITGGSDYCGFPMRKDIAGPVRKKVLIMDGVGTRNKEAGIRIRKTVCGNTIHDKISLVSMKVSKVGKKPLGEPTETPAEEVPAKKPAAAPVKEAPKVEPKVEEKPKEEPKAEEKSAVAEKPKEEPKSEEKPKVEEKPAAEEKSKEEAPKAEDKKE